MNHPNYFVGAFSDTNRATEVAEELGGTLILDPVSYTHLTLPTICSV